jgi:hypothetical protein
MNDLSVPTIVYTERLVAFIDIMGFKEILGTGDDGV